MAIKAQCGSCGAKVNAKNALAGKRVKCPKCSRPMKIPVPTGRQAHQTPQQVGAGQVASHASPSTAYNPLLDLLDEAGVESISRGPACENCGAEIHPSAVVCVQCGYNMATGQMLETTVFEDDDGSDPDSGMSDTEKILAKAERDIDEMPVSSAGQDFGDGADSLVISIVAFVMFGALVAIGISAIFLMDQLTEVVNSAFISFAASLGIALICITWITIVAFLADTTQGIVCVATLGLYCPIFGFMQGKGLLLPTIILIGAALIGLASYFFAFDFGGEDYTYLATQLAAQLRL